MSGRGANERRKRRRAALSGYAIPPANVPVEKLPRELRELSKSLHDGALCGVTSGYSAQVMLTAIRHPELVG